MVQPASLAFSALSGSAAGTDRVPVGQEGFSLAIRRFPSPRALQGHPALVYAHGFGQTRGAWNRTGLAMAAHGYAGLAYDARGHGESDRNAAGLPYTGDQFADDLIVMAGEQPEPPVLVGASMGGLFGLIAESRWPGLFRAMVLVDITPRWEHAGLQRILAFMTAFPDGFDSLGHAADAIADAARRVQCPVLLISGGRSDLVSERTVEEFKTLVPHARHVHLPQATHMVAGDDNDAFTATVLEYLAGLPAASGNAESDVTESVSGATP